MDHKQVKEILFDSGAVLCEQELESDELKEPVCLFRPEEFS